MKIAKHLTWLLLGVSALAFNAVAQLSAASDPPAAGAGNANADKAAKKDKEFYEALARSSLAEIEAGQIAQTKGSDPVKSFGKHMVDDHNGALNELHALAVKRGLMLPGEPERKQRRLAKKLNKLSGADFDREYLTKAGVQAHEDTLKLLQKIQEKGSDPDLKNLATMMKPTVEKHLQMAKDLLKR